MRFKKTSLYSNHLMNMYREVVEFYGRTKLKIPRGQWKCLRQINGFLNMKSAPNCPKMSGSWASTTTECKRTVNLTIYEAPQGAPISVDACTSTGHYATHVLDQMKKAGWGGKDYLILLTHSTQFMNWNPIVFYRRLTEIKETADNYCKRFPKTPIIYITPGYMRGDTQRLWQSFSFFTHYRQREMAHRIFKDSCVKIFDVWDLTTSVFDHIELGENRQYTSRAADWLLPQMLTYFVDFMYDIYSREI